MERPGSSPSRLGGGSSWALSSGNKRVGYGAGAPNEKALLEYQEDRLSAGGFDCGRFVPTVESRSDSSKGVLLGEEPNPSDVS